MSRAPSNFRQQDVTRAINAAKASGLPIARIEIDAKTAKIVVIVGDPKTTEEKALAEQNPWDKPGEALPRRRRKKTCE